mmetsp:Transcript_25998/g.75085  ORF Transcript_25998/g.75085 Transcript_25998/m.75085 type:complete len:209 (-) Transcript_25998:197-823(-)
MVALQALVVHRDALAQHGPHLVLRRLVVLDDVLVHPLEARCLEEGGAALNDILAAVEDGVALFALVHALVALLGELRPEPVVVGILLDLLERDDVRGHGLQLLENQVLPPAPREGPLFAVGVHRLRRIKVGQDIPVHHLELLAEPLRVEGATVGDHSARPRLLRGGDDGAGSDGHAADSRLLPVLQQRDDVEAERAVDVLLARAVRPG